MAATAYASLVSLLNTIDQVQAHPLVSTFFDINQNKTLSKKVDFLVDFVEEYSDADNGEVEDLVRRIANAAHKAEDIIEVHAADRIRGRESPRFLHDLQMIIEDIESIKEEVVKVKEETEKNPSLLLHQPPAAASSAPPATAAASSAPPATDEATTMVGFDDYKHKLLDDLLGHDVGRQIISITGMGGIGKTTLVENLYENSNTKRHFNIRVWITVSQDSSAKKVYLQALSCLGGGSVDIDTTDDQQLSHELYKILYNRRYLIVLDDVWSVDIWDKIKFFFPENRNGSRIIVTTRESKLFDHIGSSAVAVELLDKENSWKLFCKRTFPRQDFPPELEEVGKKIVTKCGGLPLAINVIGGFLGKSPRTQEYWEKIAKDKSLILNSGDNKPSSILYLSYKYLPVRLRPCFLYFGLYPEDPDIDMGTVIKHWVAEGFIKSNRGRSLEEVAESYYNDLVDRNLLSVDSLLPDWKSIIIHDLVRDLCIIMGEKEKFFCAQRSIDEERYLIADQATARFCSLKSDNPSILNPLIVPQESRPAPFKTRLLRVFSGDRPSQYHALYLQEVNMRFIKYDSSERGHYLLPSLVTLFWSLQTLFISIDGRVVAPAEIWKMPQLRHIRSLRISLPDPDPPVCNEDVCVLQNLQTLGMVYGLIFTEKVCKRIPNIKELAIDYDYDLESHVACLDYHLENLGCFNKLERLYYRCYGKRYYAGDSLDKIRFPNSLKKLTLSGCKLEWSYIEVIASLPHLQFLHLYRDAFEATEWVFGDERFTSLKHLFIFGNDDVTKWIAQSSNFPVLEQLDVKFIQKLDEIPSGIGEIPTLRRINLVCCKESACISAVEILQEQERFGNLGLRVSVQHDHMSEEAAVFIEKIQELGLTCQNLVIECESYLISLN